MSRYTRAALAMLLLSAVPAAEAAAQQREITGRIRNAQTGEAVVGAAVTVVGTPIVALSDEAGSFSLRAPAGAVTLSVAFLGFRTREVEVPEGQGSVVVDLQVDVFRLDAVVVTGLATTVARRNLGNAVASVGAEQIERVPAATIEKTLQGKIAGASIETNSGAPGGGVQVRLRGISTINADADPLYVVDGVIVSNAGIPSNQNAVTRASGGSNPSLMQDAVVNRIVDINPNDIESIEVLKGASAAAIYGAKAANGVVVITTKRGQPGPARIDLTQRFGVFQLSDKLGSRRFETVDEAVDVFGPAAADYFTPGQVFDQEELLSSRRDLSTETALSVSGGSADTRYYVAGLWKNDEGIIANTGFEKQSLRVNLDQRIGRRFGLGVNANVIHTLAERGLTNNDNAGVSFYMAFPATPTFLDLRRRPDGTYPDNPFIESNPLETAALMKNEEDVWRLIGGANFNYQLYQRDAHDLRLVGSGGVDFFSQENELFFPPELQFEPGDDGFPGTSLLTNANNLVVTAGLSAVHTYAGRGATFTTSAGMQYSDADQNLSRIESRNLIAGMPNVDAGTNVAVREQRQRTKDVGIFVQEEVLTAADRLLVTAGVRADKSSANGDIEKFFLYPKASAAYRLVNPAGFADEVKLRAAFGQTGNRPLFGQKFNQLIATNNIEGLPTLVPSTVAGDPDIHPERVSEIEAGIDATLFGGAATVELTGYQKTITDLLLQRTVAQSTGFTSQFFNGGELRVRGIEFALGAAPLRGGDLNWVTRATFFADRSRIMDLPVPSFRTGGFATELGAFQIEEGKSATQIVTNVGVDEDGELIVAAVGDANPDFRVGWSSDLSYRNLSLFFLWDWSQGATVINLTKFLYDLFGNTADCDGPSIEETVGNITVSGTPCERRVALINAGDSRRYMEDGSYIKLRELSLSYQLPQSVVASWFGSRVRSARLTLSGRNLLKITDYTGLDPEVSNFSNQPIARNIDVAPFPPSRSFWFSVDVSF